MTTSLCLWQRQKFFTVERGGGSCFTVRMHAYWRVVVRKHSLASMQTLFVSPLFFPNSVLFPSPILHTIVAFPHGPF